MARLIEKSIKTQEKILVSCVGMLVEIYSSILGLIKAKEYEFINESTLNEAFSISDYTKDIIHYRKRAYELFPLFTRDGFTMDASYYELKEIAQKFVHYHNNMLRIIRESKDLQFKSKVLQIVFNLESSVIFVYDRYNTIIEDVRPEMKIVLNITRLQDVIRR